MFKKYAWRKLSLNSPASNWYLFGLGTGLILLIFSQQQLAIPFDNFAGRALQNALHIPWFASITVIAYYLDHLLFKKSSWLRIVAALFLVATASELIQIFNNRFSSWYDIVLDMVGAGFALIGLQIVGYRKRRKINLAALVLVMAVSVGMVPVAYLLAYNYQSEHFPILYDPGSWQLRLLSRSTNRTWIDTPNPEWGYPGQVLRIIWDDSQYPGLTLHETMPSWEHFNTLEISLYVHGDSAMPLAVAVGHKGKPGTAKFTQVLALPGKNRWTIPTAHLVNSSGEGKTEITKLILHTDEKQEGRSISLGKIRLRN